MAELPQRGPGADMIGRTMGLLAAVSSDFGVETVPTGWRISGGHTRDVRRAWSFLNEDLDALQELFGEFQGSYKVQLCGPWTLAAHVEAPTGGPALRDTGLVTDLGVALQQAATDHVVELNRRLPMASLVLQLDEPSLPAVLDGRIPTASGFGRIPAIGTTESAQVLAPLTQLAPAILHCCARFPFAVAHASRFEGFSWDPQTSGTAEEIGEAMEAGIRLIMGVVPTDRLSDLAANWAAVTSSWKRTDFAVSELRKVGFSPTCGLGASDDRVMRNVLRQLPELVRRSRDHD